MGDRTDELRIDQEERVKTGKRLNEIALSVERAVDLLKKEAATLGARRRAKA